MQTTRKRHAITVLLFMLAPRRPSLLTLPIQLSHRVDADPISHQLHPIAYTQSAPPILVVVLIVNVTSIRITQETQL